MNIKNIEENKDSIPVFATTSAAAGYNVGDEGYMDLIFLRSHFVLDESSEPVEIGGSKKIQEQKANLVFSRVAAITMTAPQAEALIAAIQNQLKALAQL